MLMLHFWTVDTRHGSGHVVACSTSHAVHGATMHLGGTLGERGELADPAEGYSCDYCGAPEEHFSDSDAIEALAVHLQTSPESIHTRPTVRP